MPSPFTFNPDAPRASRPPEGSAAAKLYDIINQRRAAQPVGSVNADPYGSVMPAVVGPGSPPAASSSTPGGILPRLPQANPYERFSPAANGLTMMGKGIDLPAGLTRNLLAGENPGRGLNPFDVTTSPTTGRELLRSYGAVGPEDTWSSAALGFGAEMLADPVNLLGGAVIKPIQRAAKGLSPRYGGGIRKLADAFSGASPSRIADNLEFETTQIGRAIPADPDSTAPFVRLTENEPFDANADALGGVRPAGTYDYVDGWKAAPDSGVVPGTERKFTRQDEAGRAFFDQSQHPFVGARQASMDDIARRHGVDLPLNAVGPRTRLMEAFADNPAAFERFLQELPPGSEFLGGGMEGAAWRTPEGDVVRAATGLLDREGKATSWGSAGYGLPENRVVDPRVVQATRSIPAGPVRIERVPYTPSLANEWGSSAPVPAQTTRDIGAAQADLASRGVQANDIHPGNLGYQTNPFTGQRTSDVLQYLDPGMMRPNSGRPIARAADSGSFLTPLMERAGLTDLYAPFNQEAARQAAARGLGVPGSLGQAIRLQSLDPAMRGLGAYNTVQASRAGSGQ